MLYLESCCVVVYRLQYKYRPIRPLMEVAALGTRAVSCHAIRGMRACVGRRTAHVAKVGKLFSRSHVLTVPTRVS